MAHARNHARSDDRGVDVARRDYRFPWDGCAHHAVPDPRRGHAESRDTGSDGAIVRRPPSHTSNAGICPTHAVRAPARSLRPARAGKFQSHARIVVRSLHRAWDMRTTNPHLLRLSFAPPNPPSHSSIYASAAHTPDARARRIARRCILHGISRRR